MRYLLLLGLLVLGGCASNGAAPAKPAQANLQGQPQEVKASRPKVICTKEPDSGSHFTRRVCRTARDIEMERERERQLQDSNEVTGHVSGGG